MKVILHSLNYSPELTGIGKYNGEMCAGLVNRKVDVSVIVAPPYYPEWKIHQGFSNFYYKRSVIDGVKVTRCPIYIPKNISTLKRLLHLGSFVISSTLALFTNLFSKPDLVVLVQPTLFCAPSVLLFCKITGAKSVMHIQDFEVDASFGLGLMSNRKVGLLANKFERWLMNQFDAISTISYSMIENAKSKGLNHNKIFLFPNWSDTQFVTPLTDGSALRREWGFLDTDKIILYAGNIGYKQGLEIVLDAAKHFKGQSDIKFLFVGAGSQVQELKSIKNASDLVNVFFKPLQAWEKVPQMLAFADIHLVIQKKGVANAVLPSKLTNILSVGGHALVTAEPLSELAQLNKMHPGIFNCIEPECLDSFISGLDQLLDSDLTNFNKIARNYSDQYLEKNTILDNFYENICSLDETLNT